MEPLLAEAYEAVLRVEQLAGVSLLNRASLQGDVAAGNGAAADDLATTVDHLARAQGTAHLPSHPGYERRE